LIVSVAKWLREAQFLCANKEIRRSITHIVETLAWFPEEVVHFVPAFGELVGQAGQFMAAGMRELAMRMEEFAGEEERRAIGEIVRRVDEQSANL
jgi:hypothetical protein